MTFGFPSWRSLSPLKGHLTIPKKSQRIAWWTALYLPFSDLFSKLRPYFTLPKKFLTKKNMANIWRLIPFTFQNGSPNMFCPEFFFTLIGPAPTHKSDHTGSFRTSSFFVGENGQCGCNTWWKHLALGLNPPRGEIPWLPKLSMNCKIQTCLPFYCTWNPLRLKTLTSWWFQPIWKILVKLDIFPK